MKKEIKKKEETSKTEKIVLFVLIGLTIINLIVNFSVFPQMTYNNTYEPQLFYKNYISGALFGIFLWCGSILTYIIGIWYMILGFASKKKVVLKTSFVIFTISYTPIVINLVMNFLAKFFFVGF